MVICAFLAWEESDGQLGGGNLDILAVMTSPRSLSIRPVFLFFVQLNRLRVYLARAQEHGSSIRQPRDSSDQQTDCEPIER